MKKDSIKNVAHLFWDKYGFFIMIASLSLLLFTSCKKEDKEVLDVIMVGDLSKIVVDNIYCEYPQQHIPVSSNNGELSYFVSQFVNDDLNIQLFSFPIAVQDTDFTSTIVTDTVIGDTIKIRISPVENVPTNASMEMRYVFVNFFCTIYNVPRNKVFYVKFEERSHSLIKSFYRE